MLAFYSLQNFLLFITFFCKTAGEWKNVSFDIAPLMRGVPTDTLEDFLLHIVDFFYNTSSFIKHYHRGSHHPSLLKLVTRGVFDTPEEVLSNVLQDVDPEHKQCMKNTMYCLRDNLWLFDNLYSAHPLTKEGMVETMLELFDALKTQDVYTQDLLYYSSFFGPEMASVIKDYESPVVTPSTNSFTYTGNGYVPPHKRSPANVVLVLVLVLMLVLPLPLQLMLVLC